MQGGTDAWLRSNNNGREFNPPAVLSPTSMPQKSHNEQVGNTVIALTVIVLLWNLIPWLIVALIIYGGFQLYRWLNGGNDPRPPCHVRKKSKCRRR